MNCQDVLGCLETGGWLQKRRARCHVRRCASCAAAVAAWQAYRRQLNDVSELTPAQQRAWRSAAGEAKALPPRGRKRAVVWIAAAAALACIALALWFARRGDTTGNHAGGQGDGGSKEQNPPRNAVAQRDPVSDGTRGIRAGLQQLADDLAELRSLASTLDERRMAEELLAAHEARFESQPAEGENP